MKCQDSSLLKAANLKQQISKTIDDEIANLEDRQIEACHIQEINETVLSEILCTKYFDL